MWATIDDRLLTRFRSTPAVRDRAGALEVQLREGTITATAAANELLDLAAGTSERTPTEQR